MYRSMPYISFALRMTYHALCFGTANRLSLRTKHDVIGLCKQLNTIGAITMSIPTHSVVKREDQVFGWFCVALH